MMPLPPSLLSLPEDIVLNCLARIPRSYYPKLSLVSKCFRSLILFYDLIKTRKQLQTQEECVFVGFKSPIRHSLFWFSLWIKHDDQTLTQCTIQDKSTCNLLVPVPCSYSSCPPNSITIPVGSELYRIGSQDFHSSAVLVNSGTWREAPSMMVARMEALVCALDGKIYVMGGCRADESTNWAEVFDPKDQTWKSLPDPGPEVRYSSNKRLVVTRGKIYVMIKKKNRKYFVYHPKENKWDRVGKESCKNLPLTKNIDNIVYCYAHNKCWWCDTTLNMWRVLKGLTGLDAYVMNDAEICIYGGKLVIFWDSVAWSPLDGTKKIWCAVILLDKSLNGEVEVCGQIEWIDVVLTVPLSYTLLNCSTFLR